MAIVVNEDVPTLFGDNFVTVDEADSASADFQAPKKENRWALIELSKEQLEALEAGQGFHIKAHTMGGGSNAALSTGEQTFGLEFLENSNPMYLASVAESAPSEPGKEAAENQDPNSAGGDAAKGPAALSKQCTIFAQCRGHILLKPSFPDVQSVRDHLAPHSVDGTAREGASAPSSEPMTTSFLQYQVAASPKELKTILDEGPYVQRDGVWSWLPAAFEREVTDVVLNLISLKNWDLACVDVEALLRAVQEHFGEDGSRYVSSKDVLLNALRSVAFAPVPEKPADGAAAKPADAAAVKPADAAAAKPADVPMLEEGKFALDPDKIKVFQATQLLRESPERLRERFDLPAPVKAKRPKLATAGSSAPGGKMALQVAEFCAAFSALTGKETTIDELCKIVGDGMYIDELDGAVHVLDVTTLPQDPRERLKRLFELSSHWKPDRIASLMLPTVKGQKIMDWLMKCTRTVYLEVEKDKEVRMFTKKFAGL